MAKQMTNAEACKALRTLMDVWNAAVAAGLDPEVVCTAFVFEGKVGVKRVVTSDADTGL